MKQNKNNWYVLTGAPCSGKTSMIKLLEKAGYQIAPELARVCIDQELAKGITLEELRKDELAFQRRILQYKIDYEKNLDPKQLIFFDRGIPDSQAYYKLCGLEKDFALEQAVQNCSYKKVFLLEYIPIIKDYARTETLKEQKLLDQYLEEVYTKKNITPIKIPLFEKKDVAKRLEFILQYI